MYWSALDFDVDIANGLGALKAEKRQFFVNGKEFCTVSVIDLEIGCKKLFEFRLHTQKGRIVFVKQHDVDIILSNWRTAKNTTASFSSVILNLLPIVKYFCLIIILIFSPLFEHNVFYYTDIITYVDNMRNRQLI